MNKKLQFKKFPTLAVVACFVGILLTVINIVIDVISNSIEPIESDLLTPLFLFILVVFVIGLAAFSSKKVVLSKVVLMILSIGMMVGLFILTCVEVVLLISTLQNIISWQRIGIFTLSLLTLVVAILYFIYFVSKRTEGTEKLLKITNIAYIVLLVIFAIFELFTQLFPDECVAHAKLFVIELPLTLILLSLLIVLPLLFESSTEPLQETKQ